MIRMRNRGASYWEIAPQLGKKGVKPPGGGKKWCGATVRSIIKKSHLF